MGMGVGWVETAAPAGPVTTLESDKSRPRREEEDRKSVILKVA